MLVTPLTGVIILNNENDLEIDPVKLFNTKTNIEIHRIWGQGEIYLPSGNYLDFFSI
jgi:hypothetical protein